MIYTKVLRNYCLQNPGIVFDISNEYKGHFNMIPYHSYIKILHRLAEEGILIRYSRKAFLVAPNGNFDLDVSVKNTTLPCCSITTVKKSPGLTKATLKSLYKALFSDF